jgi:hypothetical protein
LHVRVNAFYEIVLRNRKANILGECRVGQFDELDQLVGKRRRRFVFLLNTIIEYMNRFFTIELSALKLFQ